MADEKITYRSVLKDTFKNKGWFKKYALLTLVILTLAFVTIYLNSVVPFLGAVLLIIFLIPLIITFTEYTSLVETGSPAPRDFKGFRRLFTNTYQSGRVRVILTFQMILKYFLFTIVSLFVTVLVFYFIIASFNAPLLVQIRTVMTEALNSETPELILAKLDIIEGLLSSYEAPFFLVNQILQTGILIHFINQSVFRVFTSVFIQQQPMTSLNVINSRFFSDKESKNLLRKSNFINVFSVSVLYALVYAGVFLLLFYKSQSTNFILQTDLIALIVLVAAMPFVVRFNFYMYQALAKRKEVEIMEFTISELKNILRSPMIPEESRPYIAEILKMRMSELEKMKSVENTVTPVSDELSAENIDAAEEKEVSADIKEDDNDNV